jgi:hypothetical protein
MVAAGLHDAAAGFDLSVDELAAVVRDAPSMRPDRRTVLSRGDLGEAELQTALADVLTRPAP